MPRDSRTPRTSAWRAVERLIYSPLNYWVVLVGDALATTVFLLVGIRLSHPSLFRGTASLVVGFLAWGGVEYGVHRWILHGRASIATRAHARHHADGEALIGAPALMSVALAGATWAALSVFFTAGQAALTVSGLYAGYNYYVLLHHVQHRHRLLVAWVPSLARLEHAHHTHHTRYVVNYGVSTTWWDRAFGTYESPGSLGRTRSGDSALAESARHSRWVGHAQ